MSTSTSRRVYFDTWVEGVARHIHDPVQRLRFVRVAGPCRILAPPIPRRLRAIMFPSAIATFVFLVLVIVAAGFAFRQISGRSGDLLPVLRPAIYRLEFDR